MSWLFTLCGGSGTAVAVAVSAAMRGSGVATRGRAHRARARSGAASLMRKVHCGAIYSISGHLDKTAPQDAHLGQRPAGPTRPKAD